MQCGLHLAVWVRDGAAAFDANLALGAPQLLPDSSGTSDDQPVQGMKELLAHARIPDATAVALSVQVAALGPVSVEELSRDDWRALPAWGALKEMERRRLLDNAIPRACL